MRHPALRFAAAIVLANAPFWVLGQAFFMSRAVVNLDACMAALVMVYSAPAGIVLLVVAWIGDLILSQSMTFHFRSPLEFLKSAQYAAALDWSEYASLDHALAALPFAVCGVLLYRLTRRRAGLWLPGIAFIVAFALLDALNGSSMLAVRGTWQLPVNLAGSPVSTLAASQLRPQDAAPPSPLPTQETVQGLIDIPQWASAHTDRSVLFVVVESLGAPKSPQLHAWLDRQLADDTTRERYDVRRSDLPFRGSTTAGELRALCMLSGSYRKLDAQTGNRCLPARLRELGWSTAGMHTFSRRMFDRQSWWPLLGLQNIHFIDSPLFAGQPHCGAAFRGGCDKRLIEAGVQALAGGRRFVYLLTLNTHLPLEPLATPPELSAACAETGTTEDACQLTAALGSVLRTVAASLRDSPRAPLVVIVGDHAPPFSLRASRDAFSADKVPAFVLVPRQ